MIQANFFARIGAVALRALAGATEGGTPSPQDTSVVASDLKQSCSRPFAAAVCLGCAFLLVACSVEEEATVPMQPVGGMKETMDWVLDPAADTMWGFAGFIITAEGETDLAPKNEEEWAQVKHAAWVLAESGNLLMMPGLAEDGTDWLEYSEGLRTIGNRLIEIAEAQDPEALFEAGGHLYNVCLACHQIYARDLRQD